MALLARGRMMAAGVLAAAWMVLPSTAAASQPAGDGTTLPTVATPENTDPSYMRVAETQGGTRLRLEIGSREFTRTDSPTVWLVGAVHVGETSYYEALEEFMADRSVVLYEGVKSGGDAAAGTEPQDAEKVRLTRNRLRMLGIAVERYRAEHNGLPADLDALTASLNGTMARIIGSARNDRWGRPIELHRTDGQPGRKLTFDLISLGADGQTGGDGPAADLKLSDQKPLTKKEISSTGEGLQVKLARALDLEFQLAAIDYSKPTWRNSDITVEALERRFDEAGVPGGAFLGMMDGSTLQGKLAAVLLGLIERSPQLKAQTKLMMIEIVSNAEQLLGQGAIGGGPDARAAFTRILIVDRNTIVLDDLRRLLRDEPTTESVAIFYGAGHLPDLDRRLVEEMGYTAGRMEWHPAMEIDLASYSGGAAAANQARNAMRIMIERQTGVGEFSGQSGKNSDDK